MKPNIFKGTGVAVVTPFTADYQVDHPALERQIHMLIENGIDYLVALGTTSEVATLSAEEKKAVVNTIKKTNAGRLPIVVGIGGNNTSLVVQQIHEQDFHGIAGLLSVAPYYNKPNQRGFYEHFKEVAKASPVPVILYNVPSRTAANINADTILKLAHDFKNIVAVKEASGNLEQVSFILRDKPHHFDVISGDDLLTVPLVALGAAGVISVTANVYARKFSQMTHLALNGKMAEAAEMHMHFVEIIHAFFEDGNPAGVKVALEEMGVMQNVLRLPLLPAADATRKHIFDLMDKYPV